MFALERSVLPSLVQRARVADKRGDPSHRAEQEVVRTVALRLEGETPLWDLTEKRERRQPVTCEAKA